MKNDESLIFGDGKSLGIVFKQEKREVAYALKSFVVTDLTVQQENFDISTQFTTCLMTQPSKITFRINIKAAAEDVSVTSSIDGKLVSAIKRSVFKNLSVAALFKIINGKLKKREAKNNGRRKKCE